VKIENFSAEQLHAIMDLYTVFCRAQDTVGFDRLAVGEILKRLTADEITMNEAYRQLRDILEQPWEPGLGGRA
jgi:hypothetical protein